MVVTYILFKKSYLGRFGSGFGGDIYFYIQYFNISQFSLETIVGGPVFGS